MSLAALICASFSAAAQEGTVQPPRQAPASPVTLMSPDWQSLSAEQKRLLEPLASEWNSLETSSRARWLELAARHHSMSPEDQRRLEERIAAWAKLSPVERQQARLSFHQTRQIRPQDREAKWEAYQALPAERREELAGLAAQKRKPAEATGKTANVPPSVPALNPSASKQPASALPAITPRPLKGPSLLQAKPGVSTVLITQQRPAQGPGVQRRFFDAQRLDAKTLLPRPGSTPDSGKP